MDKLTKKERIYMNLGKICSTRMGETRSTDPYLPESCWPKTREVEEECGESIYVTRHWLLQLVGEGKVNCYQGGAGRSNSLRWCIPNR